MTFFGCVYEKNGANHNPAMVSAMYNMYPQETPTQLKQFLSIVTYLCVKCNQLLSEIINIYTWFTSFSVHFCILPCIQCHNTADSSLDLGIDN